MFDFAVLDTLTLSEKGQPFTVINLKTRAPILDSEGNPVTITLKGRASEVWRDKARELGDRRREREARSIRYTPEIRDAEEAEQLAVLTTAWSFDTLDGQPFPYTPENALKLWGDRRFMPYREMAIMFVMEDSNFLAM